MRVLLPFMAGCYALSIAGCFSPEFGEGGFRCASDKTCPDGFQCLALPHPSEPGATVFECRVEGSRLPPTIAVTIDRTRIRRGREVSVIISVEHFVIDPAAVDKPKVDGSGHVHAYLDSSADGKGKYLDRIITKKGRVTIPKETPAGAHGLVFTLAHNDHDLVAPLVETLLPITVLP